MLKYEGNTFVTTSRYFEHLGSSAAPFTSMRRSVSAVSRYAYVSHESKKKIWYFFGATLPMRASAFVFFESSECPL